MFERDFIKRQIQQFGQVIQKLIHYKKQQDWQQVQMVIDVSTKQLLGLNPDLVESMNGKMLISMFQISDETDYEKCFILGRLLQEQAVVYEYTENNEQLVFDTYFKSFELLAKAMENEELRNNDNFLAVLNCCNSLLRYQLNEQILFSIFTFYNKHKYYAEAENTIVLLLNENREQNKEVAIKFYTRLLQLSDTALKNGNLPREEVLEGLKNLTS